MPVRWPRPLFYIVILAAVVIDQITKAWLFASFQPGMSMTVLPGFFNLTYVQNTGIAFGLMKGKGWLIAFFALALAVGAVYYARELNWARWEPNVVGGCLCGGAVGNLLDRARLGYVADFFDVHLGPHHWPVFNVADSLICLSVGWILLRQLGAGRAKVEGRR